MYICVYIYIYIYIYIYRYPQPSHCSGITQKPRCIVTLETGVLNNASARILLCNATTLCDITSIQKSHVIQVCKCHNLP